MSDQKPDLLNDIIQFLENEKEIYGPFSVNIGIKNKQALSTPKDQSVQADTIEKPEETRSNNVTGPDPKRLTLSQKLERCKNLDELKALCETSDPLKTDLEGTNLVFGVGNPNADLMIVGEAPGYNEDKQGEPFVGAAGQLLNKILAAINFTRDDVYIANILKHRPPDNRDPKPEERKRSLPFLYRQIDLISPKIILCVGKVSATTLLDKNEALKRMRGQFYPFRGAELTVTYHPAALLRNQKWKRPVWEDVQAVRNRYDELNGKP